MAAWLSQYKGAGLEGSVRAMRNRRYKGMVSGWKFMVRKKIMKRVTRTFAFAEVGTEEGAEVGDRCGIIYMEIVEQD